MAADADAVRSALADLQAQQSKSAGMDAAHYTRLLRTYVRAQYLLIKLSPSLGLHSWFCV